MRVVISASVAGSNRLKDAAGGKVESFLSSKGEESYCVDVGRRVCNERRRDETLLVKGCKGVSNGCMWNGVWEGV